MNQLKDDLLRIKKANDRLDRREKRKSEGKGTEDIDLEEENERKEYAKRHKYFSRKALKDKESIYKAAQRTSKRVDQLYADLSNIVNKPSTHLFDKGKQLLKDTLDLKMEAKEFYDELSKNIHFDL